MFLLIAGEDGEAWCEAARQVAEKMVFSPAFNRDKKTAVWLSQSIDFAVA